MVMLLVRHAMLIIVLNAMLIYLANLVSMVLESWLLVLLAEVLHAKNAKLLIAENVKQEPLMNSEFVMSVSNLIIRWLSIYPMVPNKLFVKLVKLIVLNAVKEKENNVKYVNPVFILIKEYAKILETDVLTQLQLVNVKIVDMDID